MAILPGSGRTSLAREVCACAFFQCPPGPNLPIRAAKMERDAKPDKVPWPLLRYASLSGGPFLEVKLKHLQEQWYFMLLGDFTVHNLK